MEIPYTSSPLSFLKNNIASFIDKKEDENVDWEVVDAFGEEWLKFNSFDKLEIDSVGSEYFEVFEGLFSNQITALDVGCGTGRWTKYVADKVKFVEAIDPSDAVYSASKLLNDEQNVRITQASVDTIPFADESFDLVFSLGVLHHIPDTKRALFQCVKKVKKGGYFIVYLYYALDNRGWLFKSLFKAVNLLRIGVSSLPSKGKKIVCDILAVLIYFPMVSLTQLLWRVKYLRGFANKIPLSQYRNRSWNIIRNDSLDRFGTKLEQRFSKKQIQEMMEEAGLKDIRFGNKVFWVAIGKK